MARQCGADVACAQCFEQMRASGIGLFAGVGCVGFRAFIAFAVFGERLSLTQAAGVALGIAAMGLMMIPASGKA